MKAPLASIPGVTALLLALATSGCTHLPCCRTATTPAIQVDWPVVAELADTLQRAHATGTFDGTVRVTYQNAPVFQQSFGYANRHRGVENGASTVSDMGSIAKTFTAAAILQLVADGSIRLDDTIGTFYPDAPTAISPATVEQLLAHASGLDNFHNDSDFEPMDRAEAERRILAMAPVAAPGESVAYSNAGYTLLAAIVERASGQPFQRYVHEHLIAPLGLQHTGFYGDAHIPADALARGYGGDAPSKTTFDKELTWALIGAGGMVTSIEDLSVWQGALMAGTLFPDGAPNLALQSANERWLLGSLARSEFNGVPVLQMGGSTDYGYTALMQSIPSHDLSVLLLLNAHNRTYGNATHHRLSRNHILPVLLRTPPPAESPGAAPLATAVTAPAAD